MPSAHRFPAGGSSKTPTAFVTAFAILPVDAFLVAIFSPAIAAPEESATGPETIAPTIWAESRVWINTKISNLRANCDRVIFARLLFQDGTRFLLKYE
jgi:hypothetical protein